MKRMAVILLCLCLLTGCSGEVFETMGPVEHVSATAPNMRKMMLMLPGDAAVLTASGNNTLYVCNDFSFAVQTLAGGDLNKTIQSVSGFEKADLTVMEKTCGDHKRYDFVWTAVGESGDILCRAAVIDDGNYHYCLTATAEAAGAGKVKDRWNHLFGSFCLGM